MTTHIAHSFAPIATSESEILILGSMPGLPSLEKQEYYGNPRNAFWRIISTLFNENIDTYQKKIGAVNRNNIALWDVLKQCTRTGSLDSKINNSSIVTNDFVQFISKHKGIKHIFFNGTKAETEFKRHIHSELDKTHPNINYVRLPSTSPAMASLNFEQKLKHWSVIKAI